MRGMRRWTQALHPHSFSSWRKRMRRARWKKKPLGPNLPVRASLGMRTADSQLSASLPSSIRVRCNAPRHPRLCRKLSRLRKFRGCLSKRPASLPAAAPGDGFQRKGPQPLPSGRLGKGSRGKPSRKGFPLASLWGRPVSLGERNGSHLPSHHHGCPLPLPTGKLVQRNIVKIRQGDQCRQLRFSKS